MRSWTNSPQLAFKISIVVCSALLVLGHGSSLGGSRRIPSLGYHTKPLERKKSGRPQPRRAKSRALQHAPQPVHLLNRFLLEKVDRLVLDINELPSASQPVEVELVGGTLVNALAGNDTFINDVDLHISGTTREQILSLVKKHFPSVKAEHITLKPIYAEGIEHFQVSIPHHVTRAQLDISLHLDKEGEVAGSQASSTQSVSFKQLRLPISRGAKLSDQLAEEVSGTSSGKSRIIDPSGHGVEDARRSLVRTVANDLPAARRLDGLLNGLYLLGKNKKFHFHEESLQSFQNLTRDEVLAYFGDEKVGPVLTGYFLNSLKPVLGRSVDNALQDAKEIGFFEKLFPQMIPVLSDPSRWQHRIKKVKAAHRYASTSQGKTRHLERDSILGVLLGDLPSREAVVEAIAPLSLPLHATAKHPLSIDGVLRGYDFEHSSTAP